MDARVILVDRKLNLWIVLLMLSLLFSAHDPLASLLVCSSTPDW